MANLPKSAKVTWLFPKEGTNRKIYNHRNDGDVLQKITVPPFESLKKVCIIAGEKETAMFDPLTSFFVCLYAVFRNHISIKGVFILLGLVLVFLLSLADTSFAIIVAIISGVFLIFFVPGFIRCSKRNNEIIKRLKEEHPDFCEEGIEMLFREELRKIKEAEKASADKI